MAFRLIILFVIIAIVELYSFQVIKTVTKSKWILIVYAVISVAAIVFITYELMKFDRSVGQTKSTLITLGLLLFCPKEESLLVRLLLDWQQFRFYL